MGELIGLNSLNAAVGTLERLLRDHIASMELVTEDKAQVAGPKHPGSLKRRASKLNASAGDGNKEITREDKVTVTVRVVFMKIGVIDTIHDRYSADVMLKSKWREPALDGKKHLDENEIDWEGFWNPKLTITNTVNDLKYTSDNHVTYDAGGKATVCETKRCSGTFFEFMELNKFPFDGQDLTITVTSERLAKELELVDDVFEPSGVNSDAFSCEQEWRLEPAIHTWTKFTIKKLNKTTYKYPTISVAAKAWRRPQFFIYNIIVIMFSICSLAFATFTVNLKAPESRLPLTFILVLTTVTFKFVVNKSLPRISYLTYLDKYILGSMIILCCVCVWHAIAGSVLYTATQPPQNKTTTCANFPSSKPDPVQLAKTIDYVAFGVFVCIYIGFHAVFLCLIACCAKSSGSDEAQGDNDESNSVSGEANSKILAVDDKAALAAANKIKGDFNYGKLTEQGKCLTPIAE